MALPSERTVFLALKHIFVGVDAENWKRKKLKTHIQQNKGRSGVWSLLEQHDIEQICQVAFGLLKKGAFASIPSTSTHLPEATNALFEQPDQNAERAPMGTQNDSQGNGIDIHPVVPSSGDTGPASQNTSASSLTELRTLVPSLYPIYIPLPTQLRLLKQSQAILERSIYEFATKRMGDMLTTKGWDCAESIELNMWPHLLQINKDVIPDHKVSNLRRPWDGILKSMSEIRHAAVHRLRLPVENILALFLDAESLLEVLEDRVACRELARLRRNIRETAERIDQYQDHLESRAAAILQGLATRKAEIERLERAAVAEVLEDDKTYRDVASAALDRALREVDADAASNRDVEYSGAFEEYHDAVESLRGRAVVV